MATIRCRCCACREIFGTKTVEHYPFTLTTAKTINFCHGQHRSVPSLRRKVPEPFAEINPRDGESCGIHDGEKMRVETAVSAITVKAAFNPQLPEKIVRVMHGWWQGCPQLELPAYDPFSTAGANVNLIMKNDIIDPITGSVPHRSYPCRIARVEESGAAASQEEEGANDAAGFSIRLFDFALDQDLTKGI